MFSLATFNVNSVRARLHVLIPWLERHEVDVMCLQETKVTDEDFPTDAFRDIGYHVAFKGQKSYNGVAIASRHVIEDVAAGFDGIEGPADESRLLRCRVQGVHIVNTYVPQGRAIDHENYAYKLEWFGRLAALFDAHYSPQDDLIWCGDLNVAPRPADVHDPEGHLDHVCFHEAVRHAFARTVSWGFEDVFRQFHPESGQYTFFDYRRRGSVQRGLGWRIDHILATSSLARRAKDCAIDLEPRLENRPSDHTILIATFDRS